MAGAIFMAWIESHQRLEKSWKLHRLAEELGINAYQAIGHLHAFWWWCLDNAGREGNLERFTPREIAMAAGWNQYCNDRELDHKRDSTNAQTSYAFCHALVSVTLLDIETVLSGDVDKPLGKGTKVHDWKVYSSRYFDIKENTERRRESERIRQMMRRKIIRKMSHTDVRDSTRPYQTRPDQTLLPTDKESTTFVNTQKTQLQKNGDAPPVLQDLELFSVDRMLCNRWMLLAEGWQKAYPGIDVIQETRNAHAWQMSRPERRKKRQAAFLQRWMANSYQGLKGK